MSRAALSESVANAATANADDFAALRSAAAVRERSNEIFNWVAAGHSPHLTLDLGRMDALAGFVAEVTRDAYPSLDIPFHSRWRHFAVGGIARWHALVTAQHLDDAAERARVAIDLAVVSVLLDAGAGDAWSYREPGSGARFARSEGLAVASFHAFTSGLFSSDSGCPCRADAVGLMRLDTVALAAALQVGLENPLVGLEERADLLRRLGRALADRPDYFGAAPGRPGHLLDFWRRSGGSIAADTMLASVLDGLSSIWPSGLVVDGVALGDAGYHPAILRDDRTNGIVPFHKLSQWLTYSLVEPALAAGLTVTGIDRLTALPEYRNGGLLIDFGVIRLRDPQDAVRELDLASPFIVEWRALTIALLDRLVAPVAAQLGLSADAFPIAKMLEGGTWAAGRQLAREQRPPAGPPPLNIRRDGTVF